MSIKSRATSPCWWRGLPGGTQRKIIALSSSNSGNTHPELARSHEVRLPRRREHGGPSRTTGVESFLLSCQEFNWDVNEAIVQKPNHHAGFPSHGGMGSMPRELIAENGVLRIVRAAPDDVAWIKIAHDKRNFPHLKPLFDLLPQK